MKKFKQVFFATLALALMAIPALAQGEPAAAGNPGVSIGTGLGVLGFGLAAGLAGIGQGIAGSKGAEGAARNPGAAESLVLFALLIVFLKIN